MDKSKPTSHSTGRFRTPVEKRTKIPILTASNNQSRATSSQDNHSVVTIQDQGQFFKDKLLQKNSLGIVTENQHTPRSLKALKKNYSDTFSVFSLEKSNDTKKSAAGRRIVFPKSTNSG